MIKDKKGIKRYSVSTTLYTFLKRVRNKIRTEDQEFWIAYGGDTGSGKSLRAMRDAYVITKNLNINHVCYDKKEFIDAVLSAKRGDVVIADEGIAIFFSRGAMTKEGRLIAELSAQIRQKNLCIMLCLPTLTSLDWLIQEKLNAVCNVWESREKKNNAGVKTYKGNADYFLETSTLRQASAFIKFLKAKKVQPAKKHKRPKPMIREPGNCIESKKKPWYPVDEKKYKNKKEGVLKKYIVSDQPTESEATKAANEKRTLQRNVLMLKLMDLGFSKRKIADLCSISTGTISDALVQARKNGGRV